MNYDQLLAESKQDCTIEDDLGEASLRTPILLSKWIELTSKESLKYKKKLWAFDLKRKERWKHFYNGNDDYTKPHRDDINNVFIKGDKELVELRMELEVAEQRLKVCEDTLKVLHQRSFHIKSAIDFRKFMAGVDY